MIYVHVVWSMKLFPARHVENIYIKIRKLLFLIIVVCGIVLYQVCLFARRNGNNSEKKDDTKQCYNDKKSILPKMIC